MFPSLTGTKLESLFGEVGQDSPFIIWTNVMSEVMPPAYLVPRLSAYLYYVVFGFVLARPYPNKLILF